MIRPTFLSNLVSLSYLFYLAIKSFTYIDADVEIGQYSCAGKQLALMELRLAIVLVALNFDLSLAPGETGVEFDQGAKDTFTLALSALQVVFQERGTRA